MQTDLIIHEVDPSTIPFSYSIDTSYSVDGYVDSSVFLDGYLDDLGVHDVDVPIDKVVFDEITSGTIEQFDEDIIVELTRCDYGAVVDFGSGLRRYHCDHVNVVEHVELRKFNGRCKCGAPIVPFMTNYVEGQFDSFVAINSVQNNSVAYQRLLFKKLKALNVNYLVSIPNSLNVMENDPCSIIFEFFPSVEICQYKSARFYRYYKNSQVNLDYESMVSVTGKCQVDKIGQRQNGSFRMVGVVAVSGNKVLCVRKDLGLCDFVAAGHIRSGETPFEAALREWKEEVVTPVGKMTYLGRVDSQVGKDLVMIFLCEIDNVVVIPSRGIVEPVANNTKLRYPFTLALEMIRYLRMWNFSIDSVIQGTLRGRIRRNRKIKCSEINKMLKTELGNIRIYENSGHRNVLTLRPVKVGMLLRVIAISPKELVENLQVLYLGVPIALGKYVRFLDGKGIYRVVESYGSYFPHPRGVYFHLIDYSLYDDGVQRVMKIFNVTQERAQVLLLANGNKLPLFTDKDARVDLESHGVFHME